MTVVITSAWVDEEVKDDLHYRTEEEDINYEPNDKKKYGQSDREPSSSIPACPRPDGEKYFKALLIMNQGDG
jgi:hypothetical protein